MRTLCRLLAALAILVLASAPLAADDLTGSESFLCTAAQATLCSADGECVSAPPWELQIPNFIKIDLAAKQLGTTEASGERRVTPIENLVREDGMIVLQGFEDGRAFSFLIAEDTGMASIAVARDGLTVTVFGPCTPVPASR